MLFFPSNCFQSYGVQQTDSTKLNQIFAEVSTTRSQLLFVALGVDDTRIRNAMMPTHSFFLEFHHCYCTYQDKISYQSTTVCKIIPSERLRFASVHDVVATDRCATSLHNRAAKGVNDKLQLQLDKCNRIIFFSASEKERLLLV